ncbi:hypothetical protein GUITHDRAFT_101050 [Guillardia theta CCMP2712]|uniref:EF-hand domain-containing protein n=2 Tax=Guillardia theta TaxID=55529 RepID=L1JYB7_GUITC|nr:hypothetical protein GUITHDRAFT_101050 [Guillardia theta CCMP2712]EKX53347.1 hypothetical protein GUITHDRAFT_101050 [Guillardia theta CCMP2712]|eukprot:XP_005840327.1 hypothetical protein GUITHDRAFT_101050 [Guillardia theta CCMP2712]
MTSAFLASVGSDSAYSFNSLRSSVSLRKSFSREGSEIYQGRVGRLEVEEISAIFRKLDLDKDGRVSDGELVRGMKHTPQVAIRFLQSDNPVLRVLADKASEGKLSADGLESFTLQDFTDLCSKTSDRSQVCVRFIGRHGLDEQVCFIPSMTSSASFSRFQATTVPYDPTGVEDQVRDRSLASKDFNDGQGQEKDLAVRMLASKQHELVTRLQGAVRDGERDALRIKKLEEALSAEAEARRDLEVHLRTAHKLEMERVMATHSNEEAKLREVMNVEMEEMVAAYEVQLADIRTSSAEEIKELRTAAEAKVASLESQVEELKKKLEEEVTSLAAANEALEKVRDEKAKLEDDKAIKGRAISQLQEAEKLLKATVSDLSQEAEKLKRISEEQKLELEQLEQQLEQERKESAMLAQRLQDVSQAYETFGERRKELEQVIASHEEVEDRKDAAVSEALKIAREAIGERDELARKHRSILAELKVQVNISKAKDGVLTLEALRRVVEVIGEDVGNPDDSLMLRCEEIQEAREEKLEELQVSTRTEDQAEEEEILPSGADTVTLSDPQDEGDESAGVKASSATRRTFGRFHATSRST